VTHYIGLADGEALLLASGEFKLKASFAVHIMKQIAPVITKIALI
jgi:hypothetical protein